MLTKKVKKRISFLSLFSILTIIAIFIIIKSLNNNILYFKSPTDIKLAQDIILNQKIRLGGMVKKSSLKIDSKEIKFIITDFKNEILVTYRGTVPNLFTEGKGVVAEGELNDKNYFVADRILAKHDENYMPPELKNIMQKNVK
jgi:cytochrome c-type biogenesis protein CcmE